MPILYTNCRCPACKAALDDVATDEERCPSCRRDLDPGEVWQTRTYPGLLTLPPWIRAFGWPLLLIVAGVGMMAGSYFASAGAWMRVPVGLIGSGFIWFLILLLGGGEEE